jgi:hypothetical protein
MVMVKSIIESLDAYARHIDLINEFEQYLLARGFDVTRHDDFELGAEWVVSLKSDKIAIFSWNVPYYIALELFDDNLDQSFDIDYVKNVNDWKLFIEDARSILTKIYDTKN